MRQSGRVRCGGRGGGRRGRHGRRGRRPPRSPLASRLRSPGTRSARAHRRSSAASRPTPRSRTRSCSLGAARVAAFGSSAWTYGGSWSRSPPPAFRSAPAPALFHLPWAPLSRLQPLRASASLGGERDPYGDYRLCLSGFSGAAVRARR